MTWESLSCRRLFDETRSNVDFGHWFELHPCLFMRIVKDHGVHWVQGSCNERASYVCETNLRKFYCFCSCFFHHCEVARPLHICVPIRVVFHQQLNSHIAFIGSPPEPA